MHPVKAVLFALLACPALALAQPIAPGEPPAPTVEDLVQAADATADVAAVTAVAEPAPNDDIDLASLGLDPTANAFDDKLNIYGYADVLYSGYSFRKDIAITDSQRGFAMGNLDLYVSKNFTADWRFLAEVRFLTLPNGGYNPDSTIVATRIGDPQNFLRGQVWGGISIERAYLEYDITDHLTIRAGRFLTPYGVWNIDHGSPVIISPIRPFIIGEQHFPEHQQGIELFGEYLIDDYRIGYHGTLSNGRGPTESNNDRDTNLAIGGRLSLEAPFMGTLKLGVSAYSGRFTGTAPLGDAPDSYDERSYGADVQWLRGPLHVQAEITYDARRFLDGHRARVGTSFRTNDRQYGGYVLAGYRFDRFWNVMPYVMIEHDEPMRSHDAFDGVIGYSAGLNFRPTPTIVLKGAYQLANLRGERGYLEGTDIDIFTMQAAWVF
ncbi:MAG TPA: hypothetical protein VK427_23105 [Kofleriaceae bacterium]|nr:hypothetical protein [Kofleriaceae bacterium]